jgi:hypothetical protein
MHLTHWKMESGKFCVEDDENLGAFGCGERFEISYLIPAAKAEEWQVVTEVFPRKIVGYMGNVFDFRLK